MFLCVTGAAIPASWPPEATSRIHLPYGSDNPCKLAAGGDISYTSVLVPSVSRPFNNAGKSFRSPRDLAAEFVL